MIDDLVRQVSEQTRLDEAQSRTALAGALGLMSKHAGDKAKLRELYDAVPGAEALAAWGARLTGGGGMLGGLMKGVGGKSGAAAADAMSMLSRVGKDGITQDDLRAVLPVASRYVKARAGRNLLKEVAESIPGLGAMLG
jgi:hypothetical protein